MSCLSALCFCSPCHALLCHHSFYIHTQLLELAIELNWIVLNCIVFYWVELNCVGWNWNVLSCVVFCYVVLSWIECIALSKLTDYPTKWVCLIKLTYYVKHTPIVFFYRLLSGVYKYIYIYLVLLRKLRPPAKAHIIIQYFDADIVEK